MLLQIIAIYQILMLLYWVPDICLRNPTQGLATTNMFFFTRASAEVNNSPSPSAFPDATSTQPAPTDPVLSTDLDPAAQLSAPETVAPDQAVAQPEMAVPQPQIMLAAHQPGLSTETAQPVPTPNMQPPPQHQPTSYAASSPASLPGILVCKIYLPLFFFLFAGIMSPH